MDPSKARNMVERHQMVLDDLSKRASNSVNERISGMHRAFIAMQSRPEMALKDGIHSGKDRIGQISNRMDSAMNSILAHQHSSLASLYVRPDP